MSRYVEFPFPGLPSISELTDASNECRHGRLPFDKGPRCSCWNIWFTRKVVPLKRPAKLPRHHRGTPYSWAVRRHAIRLVAGGVSADLVAGRVGCSVRSVRRWVAEQDAEAA